MAYRVSTPRPFGFNVIGHISGNLGLGVTARNIVQVLLDNGLPVSVMDVDPGSDRGKRDLRFESLAAAPDDPLPYGINLAVFSPPTLIAFLVEQGLRVSDPGYLNAADTVWELPVIPEAWRPALEFFDVLLAQSAFIRQTLDTTLSRTMTVAAKHPLYLPAGIRADRTRFDLGPEDLVYVAGFEFASDPSRKNVLAVVEAFERGLAEVPRARLVIKVNNAEGVSVRNRVWRALQEASARDSRIRILATTLDYASVLALYASSDIFVSLHRSEGLGLGPMEAMALGKVVVATAWSGTLEYMDHTTACLVPYRLVPTDGASGVYSPAVVGDAARWAEPDIDEAALWMRRLANEPSLRQNIGERARAAIAKFHDQASQGNFARELQAIWEHRLRADRLPRTENRLEALRLATRAAESARAGTMTNLRRAAAETLDRHLLWRFRNSP